MERFHFGQHPDDPFLRREFARANHAHYMELQVPNLFYKLTHHGFLEAALVEARLGVRGSHHLLYLSQRSFDFISDLLAVDPELATVITDSELVIKKVSEIAECPFHGSDQLFLHLFACRLGLHEDI